MEQVALAIKILHPAREIWKKVPWVRKKTIF